MRRYPALPEHIREALRTIEPSHGGTLLYYPCRVTLTDGRVGDTVYIEPQLPYIKVWGIYPEDDKAKRFIHIEQVVTVEESPIRIPARFANELYRNGESGMGYTIFTVIFDDGSRQAYHAGNAVDFLRYPAGLGPENIREVLPHEGRKASPIPIPDYAWCLYSE